MSFNQLDAGRNEPILDPDLPIIDAHHHLFHRPALRYMLDDYLKDVRAGHRIVASIYVEANAFLRKDGPELLRPLGEVEFANGMGAIAASGYCGEAEICAAIIGHADLRHGAAVGDYLDRAIVRAPERFRGIRQVVLEDPGTAAYRYLPSPPPPRALMQHPEFGNGLREITRRGLVFETAVFHHQLPDLAVLADRFPDTVISLNHAGMAMMLDVDQRARPEIIKEWRKNLVDLARRPNVVCKVGGFGLPFWGFGFEDRTDPIGYLEIAEAWRPFVETAIEAFQANRCMMESDYPIDSRSCGFVPLWNAFKHIVSGSSPEEKAALFYGTAARVYQIKSNASLRKNQPTSQ